MWETNRFNPTIIVNIYLVTLLEFKTYFFYIHRLKLDMEGYGQWTQVKTSTHDPITRCDIG